MEVMLKDEYVLAGLMHKTFHVHLVDIVIWWLSEFKRLTITESFRHMRHPNDLHGVKPVRAIDIRSWDYADPQAIAERVNEVWQYDPDRPWMQVCVYHESKPGADDWHFHVQVHQKTRRIG